MLVSETKQYGDKSYGSESHHWYTKTGEPCHQLPYKDKKRAGELRNTTLRDARELGLLPSVSGILKIVDKPGLRDWRDKHIIAAAWETESLLVADEPYEQYEAKVLELAQERMSVARDRGSEIHGAIERYLREFQHALDNPTDTYLPLMRGHSEHIKAAIHALDDLGAHYHPFRAERSFASPLHGFGGCVDFSTEGLIADYKCVTRLEKKLDYWDRAAQLASYSMGIHGKIVRCANIFIDSTTAEYVVKEWTSEELEHGWRVFCCCRDLWCLMNNYDPRCES